MFILTDVCTAVFHSSSVIFVYSRNLFIFEACGSAISTRITDVGFFSSFSVALLCQNS